MKIHRLILKGSAAAPAIIMKVYEILRCSTLKQAEESKTGLKGQRRRIAEFRRQFNLPKGQEIVDIGKSAREHLQIKDGNLGKLMRRLEKNKNRKEDRRPNFLDIWPLTLKSSVPSPTQKPPDDFCRSASLYQD